MTKTPILKLSSHLIITAEEEERKSKSRAARSLARARLGSCGGAHGSHQPAQLGSIPTDEHYALPINEPWSCPLARVSASGAGRQGDTPAWG